MKLHWEEDPKRVGRCWDLRNDKDAIVGYVIQPENKEYWILSTRDSALYDDKDEAMAVLLALVRMGEGLQ